MIAGSVVALVTPMASNGDVDWEALRRLVDLHLASGTSGIVAVGTTGESATLEVREHCEVIKRVVEQVGGKIPVIAGTGGNATREAIELTRVASRLGADACLLVTPYYNKPTQDGLVAHFSAVAEAVDVPQILYNVPGRTACDMRNDTVARLADIDNIVGIKDATGDLQRGRELIELCGDRLAVYSGDDCTAAELMLLGARGNISVTANVAPRQMAQLCKLAIAGDVERARACNAPLAALHDQLFVEANPIPVKWALYLQGLVEDGIRLPMTQLSEAYRQPLQQLLQDNGLLNL